MASLKGDDLAFIVELIRVEAGISLDDDQAYLVESRLNPVAQTWGHPDVAALCSELRGPSPDRRLVDAIRDSMTTNETSFFRDEKPFDALKNQVLPRLMESRRARRSLRIWSAACSSGQEPYSLAMMIREEVPELLGWDLEIVATDLNEAVLEQAREGRYSTFQTNRGLPALYLITYFAEDGNDWVAVDDLRRMVQFRQANLLEPQPQLGTFDIVMCRNVLIYMDLDVRAQILDSIAGRLAPDGFLFLGAGESMTNVTRTFRRAADVPAICFQPTEPVTAEAETPVPAFP